MSAGRGGFHPDSRALGLAEEQRVAGIAGASAYLAADNGREGEDAHVLVLVQRHACLAGANAAELAWLDAWVREWRRRDGLADGQVVHMAVDVVALADDQAALLHPCALAA